jgi:hypothetical protein
MEDEWCVPSSEWVPGAEKRDLLAMIVNQSVRHKDEAGVVFLPRRLRNTWAGIRWGPISLHDLHSLSS